MNKRTISNLNKVNGILHSENLYADGVGMYTATASGDEILLSNDAGLTVNLSALARGQSDNIKLTNAWGGNINNQLKSFLKISQPTTKP